MSKEMSEEDEKTCIEYDKWAKVQVAFEKWWDQPCDINKLMNNTEKVAANDAWHYKQIEITELKEENKKLKIEIELGDLERGHMEKFIEKLKNRA